MSLETEVFTCEEGSIEYGVWGGGKNTIVLLPPGIGRMDSFSSLIRHLSQSHKVIAVNLPGVGKSSLSNPTFRTIVSSLYSLLRYLEVRKPILVGESYGGDVALHLLDALSVKACVLIASGEYFSDFERSLLHFIFYPSLKIPLLQNAYSIIVRHLPAVDFGDVKDLDLNQIARRWWEIISYDLPKRTHILPCMIIWPEKDHILRKGALRKMMQIFPYAHIITVPFGHHSLLHSLEQNDYWQLYDFIRKVETDENNPLKLNLLNKQPHVFHI